MKIGKFFKSILDFFKNLLPHTDPQYPIEIPVNPPVENTTDPGEYPNIGRLSELKKGDEGVDISHHNATVNISKLIEAEKFVYLKATEGGNFVSSKYHERIDALLAKGARCGAYHYYKTNVDWLTQAKHFVKHLKGNISPVLDVEGINNENYSANKHTKEVLLFLQYIEKETGLTPIMYCGYYFAKDFIKPSPEFARYPLWLSWYTSDFSRVKVPQPWNNIFIWQYTESGKSLGVTGNVDRNIFLG